MEFGVKVDPTRQLKVFDAAQVMDAINSGMAEAVKVLEDSKAKTLGGNMDPMTAIASSLIILVATSTMAGEITKKLGLDVPDGEYIDKK